MRSRHPGLLGALAASLSVGALAALMAATAAPPPDDKPRRPRPKGKRRTVRAGYGYYDRLPAGINRHTGQPHEHAREIARRKRQAERIDANRHARAMREYHKRPHNAVVPAPNIGLTRGGQRVTLRHYPGAPS